MSDYVTLHHNRTPLYAASPHGIGRDVTEAMYTLEAMAVEMGVEPVWETATTEWEVSWVNDPSFADVGRTYPTFRVLHVSVEAKKKEDTDA